LFIKYLDQRIINERKHAEEEIELRKYQFGINEISDEN